MTHETQHPLHKQHDTDRDRSICIECATIGRLERLYAEGNREVIGNGDDRLCPVLRPERPEEHHDYPDRQKDSHDNQQVHHDGKQRTHRFRTQGLLQSGPAHPLWGETQQMR